MTTEIANYEMMVQPWYVNLVDDLKDLIVETEFTSRWTLIEGYHAVGSRILQETNENLESSKMGNFVQCIAKSLNKSERTIYYAVQFAKTYPDLNSLPEGKDCSWFKIVNKYLTTGEKKRIITKGELMKQIEEIKELLATELQKELQSVNNGDIAINKSNVEFIRYLQDQIGKITGGVNELV